MAVIFNSIIVLGLVTFQVILFSAVIAEHKLGSTSSMYTCDWKAMSNFYAIRAILENKIKANDTLLYELAGIFSDKHQPLKQVIVHYSIQIPLNEEDCDTECDLQYDDAIDTGGNCPPGYRCIETDFIWGRYTATAQDVVFKDLDVCPLVIGDYKQREVTIHFTLKSPPSCNMSVVDNDTIETEEFPCGWQCSTLRNIQPLSGHPHEAIVKAVDEDSPLDRALKIVTTKLLQYNTAKDSLPSIQYDLEDVTGYAAKLNSATYFSPAAEYGIFLSAYILLHMVVFMMIFHYRSDLYSKVVLEYVKIRHVNFSLFCSSIVTFFLFCFNISLVFTLEGGICITLLQLYVLAISLAPGLLYFFVALLIDSSKRELGFFDTIVYDAAVPVIEEDKGTLDNKDKRDDKEKLTKNDKDEDQSKAPLCDQDKNKDDEDKNKDDENEDQSISKVTIAILDHLAQTLVMWFIYTVPHVMILILLLIVVSIFNEFNRTMFLGLYFASSSVILWIANAIVIYLVSPHFYELICCTRKKSLDAYTTTKRIVFAVCLGLSLNLMNLSVVPLIGDVYYSTMIDMTTIFTIVPVFLTFLGWYLSGDLVKGFSEMLFFKKSKESEIVSIRDFLTFKPIRNMMNNKRKYQKNKEEDKGRASEEKQRSTFRIRTLSNIVKSTFIRSLPSLPHSQEAQLQNVQLRRVQVQWLRALLQEAESQETQSQSHEMQTFRSSESAGGAQAKDQELKVVVVETH